MFQCSSETGRDWGMPDVGSKHYQAVSVTVCIYQQVLCHRLTPSSAALEHYIHSRLHKHVNLKVGPWSSGLSLIFHYLYQIKLSILVLAHTLTCQVGIFHLLSPIPQYMCIMEYRISTENSTPCINWPSPHSP